MLLSHVHATHVYKRSCHMQPIIKAHCAGFLVYRMLGRRVDEEIRVQRELERLNKRIKVIEVSLTCNAKC